MIVSAWYARALAFLLFLLSRTRRLPCFSSFQPPQEFRRRLAAFSCVKFRKDIVPELNSHEFAPPNLVSRRNFYAAS